MLLTSRDGKEWKRVEEQPRLQRLFAEPCPAARIVVSAGSASEGTHGDADLSGEQGWQLAQAIGLDPEEFARRFDGTPGSLLLDLEDMRRRYDRLRDERHGMVPMSYLLDAAKLLYLARQPSLLEPILKAAVEQVRGGGQLVDPGTWEALKRRTMEEGFGRFTSVGEFLTYRPYLEDCVRYTPSTPDVEGLLPILVERVSHKPKHSWLGVTISRKVGDETGNEAQETAALVYLALALRDRCSRREADAWSQAFLANGSGFWAMPHLPEGHLEDLFRQAIQAGDTNALSALGFFIEPRQTGRENEGPLRRAARAVQPSALVARIVSRYRRSR